MTPSPMDEIGVFRASMKRMRKAASMTQEELALKAQVSISVVNKIEANPHHAPSMISAVKLANALGATLADLLTSVTVVEKPEPQGETR
jgi:DNA-binding XRE family transcriptional regulator